MSRPPPPPTEAWWASRVALIISNKNETCNVHSEARWCDHCCRGKAILITYSESICVALGIQHAKRMRRIIYTIVIC
jgi:hypothetical protein